MMIRLDFGVNPQRQNGSLLPFTKGIHDMYLQWHIENQMKHITRYNATQSRIAIVSFGVIRTEKLSVKYILLMISRVLFILDA